MKHNTHFTPRFWNLHSEVDIFDLDGTIIDSSHRAKYCSNGQLDLKHWFKNNTKENIFKDKLLPLVELLRNRYKMGHKIILCTARNLSQWDKEFIHSKNIYYDKIISRPYGVKTEDDILKKAQLQYLFNLKTFKPLIKNFYDDRKANRDIIEGLGANVYNPEWFNKQPKK